MCIKLNGTSTFMTTFSIDTLNPNSETGGLKKTFLTGNYNFMNNKSPTKEGKRGLRRWAQAQGTSTGPMVKQTM